MSTAKLDPAVVDPTAKKDSKELFYYYYGIERDKLANNRTALSFTKYKNLIEEIKEIRLPKKNVKRKCLPRHYWLLKHYDVLLVEGVEKLIVPLINKSTKILYYAHEEELYDILKDCHISTGHGGRICMFKKLSEKYKNITQREVNLFVSICDRCQHKKKVRKKTVASPRSYTRCLVDVIDYQSWPDNPFKFVLIYQDQRTKFVILRALTSKRAEEVSKHLVSIFSLFGAPSVLQLDNCRKYVTSIIESVKSIWPSLKIVPGKPKNSQSQSSMDRLRQDIENMIMSWLQGHNSNKWSEALNFVQFIKNSSMHPSTKALPYETLFGCKPKIGLKSSNIPQELVTNVNTEDELEDLVKNYKNDEPIQTAQVESPIEESLTIIYESDSTVAIPVSEVENGQDDVHAVFDIGCDQIVTGVKYHIESIPDGYYSLSSH